MPVEFLTRTSETVSGLPALPHQVSVLSLDEQRRRLLTEYKRCEQKIVEDPFTLTVAASSASFFLRCNVYRPYPRATLYADNTCSRVCFPWFQGQLATSGCLHLDRFAADGNTSYNDLNKKPSLICLFCNRTWDNILCWPDTPAGSVARQPCPQYINMFDQGEFVTRRCIDNGTWWVNPETNLPWTNYSACEKSSNKVIPQLIKEHMPGIKLMYTIGYSLSLTALILALTIMIYFKRLHCPRNIIHMNMFLAFGVRSAFSLMKTVLLVSDLGFSRDVNQTQLEVKFVEAGNHWECKLFFTLFYYIIFSSVMWLFNEGLYLQLILSISVFNDKTKVRWFVLVGWGIPFVFVIPWVISRIYLDDMLCWNVHMYRGLYWIIHGPMVASVAINFVIFINTVRLLFSKLSAANCPESKVHRYRKLFKSTLILIPLFAVYYIIFLLLPDDVSATVDLFKAYVEMLFNSFQGFLVALLFCFLNHEVQYEIRTKWRRRILESNSFRSNATVQHSFINRFSSHRNNQYHGDSAKCDPAIDNCKQAIKSVKSMTGHQNNLATDTSPPSIYRNNHLNTVHFDEVVQPLVHTSLH